LEETKVQSLELETEDNLLTLDETMSRQIRQALQKSDGRVSGPKGAAQLLGINSNTLRSRMKKLGIPFKHS
jgi:transcriptional regulator with GAF, ATPase, and Fis domain